jgi:hypothetical protein
MTATIITELEGFLAGLKTKYTPEIKTAENDVKAIGSSALNYIETNGLKDLYTIAMSVLAGTAAGTPWATTMATVVTQGEAAGIAIAKGAESVVLAQAQADMIAAGQLLPPVASAPGAGGTAA